MITQILKRVYHTKPKLGITIYASDNYNAGNYIVKEVTDTHKDLLGREYYEMVLEMDKTEPEPTLLEETAPQEEV